MPNIEPQHSAAIRRKNPFFHRGPIQDPDYFFGREKETRLLLNLAGHGQSVSVLGQRRIGKTSFLFHVSHPLTLQAHGLSTDQYIFVYIDCEGRGQLTEGDLYQLLLKGLASQVGMSNQWQAILGEDELPLASVFETCLQQTLKAGYRIIFLLDEFEAIINNRNLGPDFFSTLRRIATEHAVAYITVTKLSLLTLTNVEDSALSSPFFNIFQPLQLDLLTAEESLDMIQSLARMANVSFPAALIDFILDLAGRHPLFLQLAAFYAFELLGSEADKLSQADYALLREQFWATAVQHFKYYWGHLNQETRYTLAALPLMPMTAKTALADLEKQCLIVPCGQGYDYFSSAFRDFVRGQTVSGLVQAGPFVADLQQRAVTLKERRLDLTKTQYDLLVYLLQHPDQVITHEELEETIWGDAYTGNPERLKSAIKHLRRALNDDAEYIASVRGVGYKFQRSPG